MRREVARALSRFDRDDVLAHLGLEPRRRPLRKVAPALATFGAGLLLGAGLVLIWGGGAAALRRTSCAEDDPANGHA